MRVRVLPELELVVRMAREADITIKGIEFIRDEDTDVLTSLALDVDGEDPAVAYFSWMLQQQALQTAV